MQNQKLEAYRPSGKLGFSLFIALPVIIGITAVLSFIYSLVVGLLPTIYLSVFVFAGFVIVLGVAAGMLPQLGKVRSPSLAMVLGLLVGLSGLYFSWLAMLPHTVSLLGGGTSVKSLLSDPVKMWDLIQQVADRGYYSIFSFDVNGVVLWGIWGIEALGVILMPTWMSYDYVKSNVFCETCKKWADEEKGLIAFFHSKKDDLMEQFPSGDIAFIDNAVAIDKPTRSYYQVDSEACSHCDNLHALSLRIMEKDNDNFVEQTLFEDLLIDQGYYNKVKELQELFPSPKGEKD